MSGELPAIDLQATRAVVAAATTRTPVLECEELSELAGTRVALKAECLQVTGSFKLRGALSKLSALGERAAAGVVTASAGNHARALAHAARLRGVACEVFMPHDAAVSKVAALEQLGARVHLQGSSVDDALASAERCARESGAELVHPFDDPDVIAGQATLGMELVEDVPELARVLVPVGGGGLASGVGLALRAGGVETELVGVQARACAPFAHAFAGLGDEEIGAGATVADGIAVKHPGVLTMPLLRELLSGVRTVAEDEIADAMVFLAETAKLVVEGAGAVTVAALLGRSLPSVDGVTVAIVSGGNVDSSLLAGLLLRHETELGRRVRLFTRVPDRPGGLAELLNLIARARANVVSVEHVRDAVHLGVRETGVELTLETRGRAHTAEVLAALEQGGYDVRLD